MAKSHYQERIDQMLHEYFPDTYPDPNKKTEKKKMTKPKRVGTNDREQCTTHIQEAFAGGYILSKTEMDERINKAQSAEVRADLDGLVDDLPSLPELRGEKIVPKKVRQWGFGLHALARLFSLDIDKGGHPALAPFILFVMGLMVGIVPSVLLGNSYLVHLAITRAAIAFLVIIGASAALVGFIRMIWYFVEEVG